jgi:hypothetical protein
MFGQGGGVAADIDNLNHALGYGGPLRPNGQLKFSTPPSQLGLLMA